MFGGGYAEFLEGASEAHFEVFSRTPSSGREVSASDIASRSVLSDDVRTSYRSGGNAPIDSELFEDLEDLGFLMPE